jgi:hypothetical protein
MWNAAFREHDTIICVNTKEDAAVIDILVQVPMTITNYRTSTALLQHFQIQG